MIDPNKITNFNRTDTELEEFWLFSLVVAGKTATTQAKLLDGFLIRKNIKPFDFIRDLIRDDDLLDFLKLSHLGQYTRLEKAFRESLTLNLRTATVQELEAISGVGPKTARFFLLHSRPNQRLAALDTHILKHLKHVGVEKVPKSTPPSGNQYTRLENSFIKLAEQSGFSLADYDLMVWRQYSERNGE